MTYDEAFALLRKYNSSSARVRLTLTARTACS